MLGAILLASSIILCGPQSDRVHIGPGQRRHGLRGPTRKAPVRRVQRERQLRVYEPTRHSNLLELVQKIKMELLKSYALSFLGTPYLWSGHGRQGGLDCSGYVQEVLRSVGIDPPGDQTAQGLFNHFSTNGTWNIEGVGALAFYGPSATQITHVALMLDPYRVIEAGGGGHKILTKEDAAKSNAEVRIRPLKYRPDLRAVIKPRYVGIGVI